jgi:hypothetical protein
MVSGFSPVPHVESYTADVLSPFEQQASNGGSDDVSRCISSQCCGDGRSGRILVERNYGLLVAPGRSLSFTRHRRGSAYNQSGGEQYESNVNGHLGTLNYTGGFACCFDSSRSHCSQCAEREVDGIEVTQSSIEVCARAKPPIQVAEVYYYKQKHIYQRYEYESQIVYFDVNEDTYNDRDTTQDTNCDQGYGSAALPKAKKKRSHIGHWAQAKIPIRAKSGL